jgi:hypothetical protein
MAVQLDLNCSYGVEYTDIKKKNSVYVFRDRNDVFLKKYFAAKNYHILHLYSHKS